MPKHLSILNQSSLWSLCDRGCDLGPEHLEAVREFPSAIQEFPRGCGGRGQIYCVLLAWAKLGSVDARRTVSACEEDFKSQWMSAANLSAYVNCLYELRTRRSSVCLPGYRQPRDEQNITYFRALRDSKIGIPFPRKHVCVQAKSSMRVTLISHEEASLVRQYPPVVHRTSTYSSSCAVIQAAFTQTH